MLRLLPPVMSEHIYMAIFEIVQNSEGVRKLFFALFYYLAVRVKTKGLLLSLSCLAFH